MEFHVEQQDNYVIFNLEEYKLDAAIAPKLKAQFITLHNQGVRNIIFDMGNVKYCDSSGLSAILIGNRQCKQSNGSFVLCKVQKVPEKLMQIAQLDKVLSITPTLPEAIDMLFMEQIERDLDDEA